MTAPITTDELKAEIKKLSMRGTEAKMALHDLSEELPTDWQKIPEVAQSTFEIFKALAEARKQLKALESA